MGGAAIRGWRTDLVPALVAVAVGTVLALGPALAGIRLARVTSNSMAPAFRVGDWVLEQDMRRAPTLWVRRGEVVVFRYPSGSDRRAIKRVFGLPGDRIVVGKRAIGLNGGTIPLPDTPGYGATEQRAQTVPAGAVFLLGDNRAASVDSRHFGPAMGSDVVGRVLLVLPGAVFWGGLCAAVALAIGSFRLARAGGLRAGGS